MFVENSIQRLHVIFKTHLDVGFTGLARNVVARYFSDYIPCAIDVARQLREQGGLDRFVWTVGSWLIYEYLEQASPQERRRMEAAIAAGDIVWHGLPFTTHSELMDASLFRHGLSLSQELDRRFGKKTIAAKLTDVPGHTRGIVPLLAQAGIRFLHIGVNYASRLPDVPPLFIWQSPDQAQVVVMYQHSYGATMAVPGIAQAIAFAHADDNQGPPSAQQVISHLARLRRQFPGAEVAASTLDAFAGSLSPIESQFPRVTAEIGDTWIHGVGSDPQKVSRFRELCRLRLEWLASGRVTPEDRAFAGYSRQLLMIPEHTWGMDVKTFLADCAHYSAASFRSARKRARFKLVESSWAEQRQYLDNAVHALGNTALGQEARRRLAAIEPARPDKTGFTRVAERSRIFETPRFKIAFDRRSGAITTLVDRATGRNWASPRHTLALFHYETFSSSDYDRFYRQYVVNKRAVKAWAVFDFTKPGIERVAKTRRAWQARVVDLYHLHGGARHQFLIELALPRECWARYGGPKHLVMHVLLPDEQPTLRIDLQWFDKPACRLPEAAWLSFSPLVSDLAGWKMDKMGRWVSPCEVIRNGNRRLHAVGTGVCYAGCDGQLIIETLDAPLVAPGKPSLLDFSNRQPPLAQGMHFNLANNVWGTNFAMWSEGDARFRFVVHVR